MPLAAGTRLGSFEILEPLGAGGMGEVYRARDARLGREVAIKVLPSDLSRDVDRLSRFEKEARAASALNHPNIVTIHDFGDSGNTHFLVMELVSGSTLRQLLVEPLPLRQQLRIAAQVADGLARAHAAGIVHRDLKPDNVMVTPEGVAKIMDFGLAKLESRGAGGDLSEAATETRGTEPGVVLGTVGYMSPEQASGKPLDYRSDQFSLGVILYEMASGRRAFSRATAVETLAAILRDEPEPLPSGPSGPPLPLRWIVLRCLAKDPRERYSSTEDLARDLAVLRDRLPETQERSSPAVAPSPRRWAPLAGWALSIVLLGLLTLLIAHGRRARPVSSGSEAIITQLTNGESEGPGAISPDGKQFAFVSEQGGSPEIWVRQISGGEPVRITRDGSGKADLVYAPDGEFIYFVSFGPDGTTAWRVPPLGGTPRKIAEKARYPSLSLDGKRLAFARALAPDFDLAVGKGAIVVASPDGASPTTVYEGLGVGPLCWSPDGRFIAFNEAGFFETRNLRLLDVGNGRAEQLTRFPSGSINSQAWLPDGESLVLSRWFQFSTFSSDLGVVSRKGEFLRRLTLNVKSSLDSPSISANGRRLLATMSTPQREVWEVPLGLDPVSNGRNARRILDSSWDPLWTQVSRDGSTLLFNSTASGSRNLWTVPVDGKVPPRQITFLSGNAVTHASLSPDGSRVAYAAHQNGNADIWVADLDGSNALQLTNDPASDFWPAWSPDGQWILFGSLRGGQRQLWKVPSVGGKPEQVTKNGGFRGDWSPSGKRIVYWTAGRIEVADAETGEVLRTVPAGDLVLSLPAWSPDGRHFSVTREEADESSSLWVLDAETGEARRVATLPARFHSIFRANWGRDGQSLIVNRDKTISHIVLIEDF